MAGPKTNIHSTDESISGSGFWHGCENAVRRGLDILVSGLGMILFLPAYLLILFMIKRDDRGKAIVTDERVGMHGRRLKIRKFRTTVDENELDSGLGALAVDELRITRFGRFLREMKLDELPQMWNVFVGDMSLTGPRPDDPKIVEDWPDEIRQEILSVRPGLTSPASILYRNMENLLSAGSMTERNLRDILPSRLRLDLIYLRNRNLLSDLDVVFWTAATLLPGLRPSMPGYQPPEQGWFARFSHRPSFWFCVDFLVSAVAVAVAGGLQRLIGPLHIGLAGAVGIGLIISLLYSLTNFFMGVDRITWDKATAGDALDLAIFNGVVILLLFIGNRVLPGEGLLPVFFIFASGVLCFSGFVLARYQLRLISGLAGRWIALRGRGFDQFGERMLILGAGETGRFVIDLLRNGPLSQAYNLVGIVDDDQNKWGSRINGLEVIGSTNEIPGLVYSHDVGLVLFAINEIQPAEMERITDLCRHIGVRIIRLPEVMERLGSYFTKDEGEREVLVGKVLQDTSRDRLTGAYNRQSFTVIMKRELAENVRYRQTCSLIALEVRYLWPDGAARSRGITAQVLQVVAERAAKNIRDIDILGRYGENELTILLPKTDQASANRLAERLHKELTATPVWTDRGPLNVSLGIAVLAPAGENKNASAWLEKAFEEVRRSALIEPSDPAQARPSDPFQFERNP